MKLDLFNKSVSLNSLDIKGQFKELILSGDIDSLDTVVRLKYLKDELDELIKDSEIKDVIEKEVMKYGKKCTSNGFTVSIGSKKTYDFSNDPTIEELKKKIKEREALLKSITSDNIVDAETGLVLQKPEYKTSSYIKIETSK